MLKVAQEALLRYVLKAGLDAAEANRAGFIDGFRAFLAGQNLPIPDDIETHVDAALVLLAAQGLDAALKLLHGLIEPDALAGPPAP